MKGKRVQSETSTWVTWIKEKLEDGEWHDVDELTQGAIAATGVEYFKARAAVSRIAGTRAYEGEYKKGGRPVVLRVRKHPDRRPFQNLQTCSTCGRPDLTTGNRIRKDIRYYSVKGTYQRNSSSTRSEFLCIPCAKTEVAHYGQKWHDPK